MRSWIAAAVCGAMLLSGCQSVREATGAAKTPPDEFTVLTKSPLVIPPDYNLRPPQPGIASRNDPDAGETGGNLNLPQGATTAASLGATYSDGEKLLLTKTNALSVDPNIRKTVTTDVGLEDQGPGFAQKVLFQGADPPKPAGPMAAAAAAMAPAATAPAAMARQHSAGCNAPCQRPARGRRGTRSAGPRLRLCPDALMPAAARLLFAATALSAALAAVMLPASLAAPAASGAAKGRFLHTEERVADWLSCRITARPS